MEATEKKHQFVELRARGTSLENIAKCLKVSKTTLINWGKELSIEVSNAKQFEKDVLVEKYKASHHQRVEALLKLFEKLNAEFDKRDFSDLPTVKLIEQIQQTYHLINKELTPFEISEEGDVFASLKMNIARHQI